MAGVSGAGQRVDGITEPVRAATLSTTVRGTVRVVHAKEGDSLNKDDVILELDSSLEALEADRRKLVWESRIEVESAEKTLKMVGKELQATRKLFQSTGSVSAEEIDRKELEHTLAAAEFERLQIAEQREEIEYQMSLEQLRLRRLQAPFDGTITDVVIEQGESCEPHQPLVRIIDRSRLHFVANVKSELAARLSEEMPVQLELRGGSEAIIRTGHIVYMSPEVDPASGLQEIKALIENADGAIRPGVMGSLILGEEDTDVADR
jgi:RND family efflux transporter MFP subunit